MPFSGRIGGGASQALKELIARSLLEQQQQESVRRFDIQQRGEDSDRQLARESFQARLAGDAEDRTRQKTLDLNALTRQQKEDDRQQVVDDRVAGKERAGLNLAQLGPLVDRKTPQGRSEILGQLARIDPKAAGAEMLEPSAEETIALKERERQTQRTEGMEDWKTKADYDEKQMRERPQRPPRSELSPGQAFSATRQLRNDFTRETSAAREVNTQFQIMQSALQAAKAGDMAAGSQGVLVTFQKILDPGSVVRESEYARSASGQSLLNRIQGATERLKSGGAGVPVEELERFVALAKQFTANQQKSAKESRKQIDGIAEEYGLDPSRITRDIGDDEAAPEGREITYVKDASGKLVRKP